MGLHTPQRFNKKKRKRPNLVPGEDLPLLDIESCSDQISNSCLIKIVFLTYFKSYSTLKFQPSKNVSFLFHRFFRFPERQNSSIFSVAISISLSVWPPGKFEILYRSIDLDNCFEIGSAFQTSIPFEITSNENSLSPINRANPKEYTSTLRLQSKTRW